MWWLCAALASDKPEGPLPCADTECSPAIAEDPPCRVLSDVLDALKPAFPEFGACIAGAKLGLAGPSLTIDRDGAVTATTSTGDAARDRCASAAFADVKLPPAACALTISWPLSVDPAPARPSPR